MGGGKWKDSEMYECYLYHQLRPCCRHDPHDHDRWPCAFLRPPPGSAVGLQCPCASFGPRDRRRQSGRAGSSPALITRSDGTIAGLRTRANGTYENGGPGEARQGERLFPKTRPFVAFFFFLFPFLSRRTRPRKAREHKEDAALDRCRWLRRAGGRT